MGTLLPSHHLVFSGNASSETASIPRIRPGLGFRRTTRQFANHVRQNLLDNPTHNELIIISRRSEARASSVADGRPHIRSISNHDELTAKISTLCKPRGIKFHNVFNEDLTFTEQLNLYNRTKYVIGQHGPAIECFSEALKLRPNQPSYWKSLFGAYAKRLKSHLNIPPICNTFRWEVNGGNLFWMNHYDNASNIPAAEIQIKMKRKLRGLGRCAAEGVSSEMLKLRIKTTWLNQFFY